MNWLNFFELFGPTFIVGLLFLCSYCFSTNRKEKPYTAEYKQDQFNRELGGIDTTVEAYYLKPKTGITQFMGASKEELNELALPGDSIWKMTWRDGNWRYHETVVENTAKAPALRTTWQDGYNPQSHPCKGYGLNTCKYPDCPSNVKDVVKACSHQTCMCGKKHSTLPITGCQGSNSFELHCFHRETSWDWIFYRCCYCHSVSQILLMEH